MAVVLTRMVSADEVLGVWKITEPEDEFMSRLATSPWIDNMLEGVSHPIKRLEYLASRFLTEHLARQLQLPFFGIHKDSHGKPHPLTGKNPNDSFSGPGFFLSLSHSFPYAASCIHKKKAVGIDIETPKEKFLKVRHKYLNEQELAQAGDDIEKLCLMWAVKEALYKMNGKNAVSLRDDMYVKHVENTKNQVLAAIQLNGKIEDVNVSYFNFEGKIVAFTR